MFRTTNIRFHWMMQCIFKNLNTPHGGSLMLALPMDITIHQRMNINLKDCLTTMVTWGMVRPTVGKTGITMSASVKTGIILKNTSVNAIVHRCRYPALLCKRFTESSYTCKREIGFVTLRCRFHQAEIEQVSTGHLHLVIWVPLEYQKRGRPSGRPLFRKRL